MKTNTKQLSQALTGPSKLASKRSTLPIINCVRLEAIGGVLAIAGTNLDAFEVASVKCEGDLEPTCILADLFSRVISKCGDEVDIELKAGKLHVGGFKLSTLLVEEFPKIPGVDGDAVECDSVTLANALEAVAPMTSTDASREAIQRVRVEIGKGHLNVVATDGKRLALFTDACDGKECGIDIHRDHVPAFVASLVSGGKVTYAENWIHSQSETRIISVKRGAFNFPNWRQVIPSKQKRIASVKVDDAMPAISAAQVIVSEKFEAARFEFKTGDLTIKRETPEHSFSREIEVDGKGVLTFAANPQYIADAVKAADSESVTFEGVDELSPVVIKGNKVMSVVMPMRLT